MKERYQTSISLSRVDKERTEKLNNKGIKTIDIYRAGLDAKEKSK